MNVKKSSVIKKELISVGTKTYRQVLISSEEAPNFALRKFIIDPNGFMPLHTNLVEHEQYVLNGKAEVKIGLEIFKVEKNDVVYIPAGTEHYYKNISNEPFEFLCIVPNKKDKISMVD